MVRRGGVRPRASARPSAPTRPSGSDLRRVVHELVETVRDEVVELHLTDRPLAGERRANADTEDTAFRERRVDDAVAELGQQRAQQQERVAVGTADILAIDEDPRVRAQCVANTSATASRKVRLPRFARARLEPRQRRVEVNLRRAAGSSTSIRVLAGSVASTPAPASSATGQDASTTARAC